MASYTDIIPKFNPYIQQLPVEAMVQVGMEKQKRYDEGVQKIQSYIDNIAGLELSKPVHKQYLQSKLNELGNNLRTVAAGDFSNFQLVNSIGGMVNQITKDPTIQNALYSTQKVKKGNEEVDAARKDGKGSAQNEAKWSYDVSNWLNDGDVNSSFTAQYTPYIDLPKKWLEIQKSLDVEEISRDLPFLQDEQGRFTDAKGNLLPPGTAPVLNDVMIRKIFKGKSPQAVKDAITSSMNENDIRQLNIDAWYHYRNTTPDQLRVMAANDQNEYIGQLNVQMQGLESLKQLNPSNNDYQDRIEKEIEEVETDYKNSMTSYDQMLKLINENPDAFKNAVYSRKTIDDFAKKNSKMSEIQQILDNPYQEKLQKDRQYNLAVDSYFETMRHNKATEAQSYRSYLLSLAEFEAKNKPMIPGTLQIPNLKDLEKITLGGFQEDLQSSKQQVDDAKNSFRNTYYNGKEGQFEKDYAFHLQNYRDGVETATEWVQLFDMVDVAQRAYDDGAALLKQAQAEVDAMPEFKGPIRDPNRPPTLAEAVLGNVGVVPVFGIKYPEAKKTMLNPKEKKLEEIIQQKIIQTYRPEAATLNTSSKQQLDFVRGAFNQYLTKISTSGGQEKTAMTKGFDLSLSQKLNSSDGTNYGMIRQGNQVYLTMQGKEGDLQIIQTNSGEFGRVFGYSPTSPVQQVSDLMSQFGNTNPDAGSYGFSLKENPNAYKTARYAKIRGGSSQDAFPMISQYNIKADFIQLPKGNYQTLFYIQDPVSGKWKTKQSSPGSDLNALRNAFNEMTDVSVGLMLKK